MLLMQVKHHYVYQRASIKIKQAAELRQRFTQTGAMPGQETAVNQKNLVSSYSPSFFKLLKNRQAVFFLELERLAGEQDNFWIARNNFIQNKAWIAGVFTGRVLRFA